MRNVRTPHEGIFLTHTVGLQNDLRQIQNNYIESNAKPAAHYHYNTSIAL